MTPNKKVTATGSITYTQSKSDNLPGQGYDENNVMQSIGGWFGRQINMTSLKKNWNTYNQDGNPYNWNSNYHNNPYWTVYNNTNSMLKDHIYGNMSLDYKFADWISVMGRLGIDWYRLTKKRVSADGSIGIQDGGAFSEYNTYARDYNADFLVSFHKKFFDRFGINGNIGANYRDYTYNNSKIEASSLTVPNLYNIKNASGAISSDMETRNFKTNSVFASVSMDYNEFIFLDLTGRNDWCSTLQNGYWSFFYPSVTASWIITESLPIKSNVISFAKLRASWAKVGNATDPYKTSLTYTSLDNSYDGTTLYRLPKTSPPAILKPEKVISTEVGVELKLFKYRLGLNATYYDKVTKNQIMDLDISDASGYEALTINAGEIENSGIELELTDQILKSKKGLNWQVGINWAKNKNQVNELYDGIDKYQISRSWNGVTIEAIPGESFGIIKGYGFAKDKNGNLMVDDNGLPQPGENPEEIGRIMPDWTGGISNSFSWRNFNASLLVDMRWGGDIFSVTDWFGGISGTTKETVQMASRKGAEGYNIREVGVVVGQDVLKDYNVVTKDGSENKTIASAQDYYESYWGIEKQGIIDGSFIKLREFTFGYSVPVSILDRTGFIKSANVSFVGRNLAILWTHKSNDTGIDPETAFGTADKGMGIEQYQLPATRNLGFKLSLTF